MEARINSNELELLTWLHENAEGYGPTCSYDVAEILQPLAMEPADFRRAVTYLAGWQLIGFRDDLATYDSDSPVYLTSLGESYMREVDEQLAAKGVVAGGKRLTVAALRAGLTAAVNVGTAVLTEMGKGLIR